MSPTIVSLEFLGTVASIVTAIIAAVGVLPLYITLRQTERSLRFDAYARTHEMLERHRDARKLLGQIGLEHADKPLRPLDLKALKESAEEESEEESEKESEKESEAKRKLRQLDELARVFDRLGLMVRIRALPIEFVHEFYTSSLVLAWYHLGPGIEELRVDRKQPTHMWEFEMLAVDAMKWRNDYRELKEEDDTFRQLLLDRLRGRQRRYAVDEYTFALADYQTKELKRWRRGKRWTASARLRDFHRRKENGPA